MKDYISKRLGEMKDVSEKIILREAMETIFNSLYDETELKYEALRQRILLELPLEVSQYSIYTGVIEKERLDGSHQFLFPMAAEDTAPLPDFEMLSTSIGSTGVRLPAVFLEADYLVCKEFGEKRRLWPGVINTSAGDIHAKFRFVPADRYLAKIYTLYQMFCFHNIPWVTINSPYFFKIFDVELVELGHLETRAEIPSVTVDGFRVSCGEYEKAIRYGLCPVWNIQRRILKGEDFPVPALDKVNFEYRFDLTEEGAEHGYLAIGGTDIIAARREPDSFIVTSPLEKGLKWELYKIWQRKDYSTDRYVYPVVSNRQEDSFSGRMVAHYGAVIKTRAELERLLFSYEASQFLAFISYQISWGEIYGETYEINQFIVDEVRDAGCTKSMLLKFRAVETGNFLTRDMMSFLVSQVQLVYPEYHCVGVLV